MLSSRPGDFFVFCLGGVISKMDFRRRPFNQKPLVFRKTKPMTHLEVQGSFGDEGTFQECQKTWFLKKPTIRWDRKLETRVYFDAESVSAQFCRVKTAWIAIWGKIWFFERKFSFSVFSPIGHIGAYKVKSWKTWFFCQNTLFCPILRFRPFWHDRTERKDILRRNRPRVSNFLSHQIVES